MIIYNILNFTSIVSSKIINYCSNVCKDIIIEYVNIINKRLKEYLCIFFWVVQGTICKKLMLDLCYNYYNRCI